MPPSIVVRVPRSLAAVGTVLCAGLSLTAPVAGQSAAVQRARELVEVVNAADFTKARAFVRERYAPGFRDAFPEGQHVGFLLSQTGGRPGMLALAGVEPRGATGARAAVRNTLTEEIDSLFVETEAAAPHRITRVGGRPGAGGGLSPESARTDADRVRELDRLVRKLVAADAFSGVVLFAKDGKPLYHEAFGIANRDYDVPVTRLTRFNLGSANKNMTATMIGQLVEEGKLSWDDPLSTFVPDFPDSASARTIRIKHLLSHTSGLGSYFNEKFITGSRAQWRTVDDFLALARPDSLQFAPGTRWSYSNTGMMVLGKVIEVVTGKDYFTNAQERIFDRVGMPNSGFYDLERVNHHLSTGYTREFGPDGITLRNNLFEHVVQGGPAGGGWSTAADILAYSEALRSGKLVSKATFDLMRSPKPELHSTIYGYGNVLFEGPDIWGHGGDFTGIDFDWNGYGDSGYTLVVMANYDRVNDPIKRKVTRMLRAAGAVAVASR